MSLFLCDNCGVIENTALSHYWSAGLKKPQVFLCSECDEEIGRWHGKFPRDFPTTEREIREIGLSSFVRSDRLTQIVGTFDDHVRWGGERGPKHTQLLVDDIPNAISARVRLKPRKKHRWGAHYRKKRV